LEKFGELWKNLVKFVSFLKILLFSEIVSVFGELLEKFGEVVNFGEIW